MQQPPKVLLLGIGNVLWADEGFGVRVAEAIQQNYEVPGNVVVMDGGTQGIYLIQHVQAADVLVVFDAIDYGLPPATLKIIEGDAVPKFMGAKKMSLHQTGFQEVLAMAEMLGDYPEHLLLIGVQPVELEDYGGSLRPQVKDQITPAINRALEYLQRFDIYLSPKQVPKPNTQSSFTALDLNRYESERPSEQAALRKGDARVVLSHAFTVGYRPTPLENDAISVDVDHRGKYESKY
jgi:hydrogenase maturation protease